MNKTEKNKGEKSCVNAYNDNGEGSVHVKLSPSNGHRFPCNECFPAITNQDIFFEECGAKDLLMAAIEGTIIIKIIMIIINIIINIIITSGYRTCMFAFGQTGAGKTYTMVGPGPSIGEENCGLLSRSLDFLYNELNKKHIDYLVRISCLEIYHEQVYDLFSDERERSPLVMRESVTDGFYLEGINIIIINNIKIIIIVNINNVIIIIINMIIKDVNFIHVKIINMRKSW